MQDCDDLLQDLELQFAEIAVTAFLKLHRFFPTVKYTSRRDSLSRDADLLLTECEALQRLQQNQPNPGLEYYASYLTNWLIDFSSTNLVPQLSPETLEKLSILVGLFEKSPLDVPPQLFEFLRSPDDNYVWERLRLEYQARKGEEMSLDAFKQSFDVVLIFAAEDGVDQAPHT